MRASPETAIADASLLLNPILPPHSSPMTSFSMMAAAASGYELPSSDLPSTDCRLLPGSPEATAFNFAKAVSLTSLFHPSPDDNEGLKRHEQKLSRPGFLISLAGTQQKLARLSEILDLSMEQIQSQ